MEIIKPDINIPFIGMMKTAGIVSAVLIVVALAAMVKNGGLIYGIDFAGGSVVEIKFSEAVEIGKVRDALARSDLGGSEIKHFGGDDTVLISTELSTGDLKGIESRVKAALDEDFASAGYTIQRLEMVGPKVGADLRRKGLQAGCARKASRWVSSC